MPCLCPLFRAGKRRQPITAGCRRVHTLSHVLVCSKPGVGSRRLLGVVEALLDNPAMVIHHGFNDLDRHPSVDGVCRVVRILCVLHELLDPLRWVAEFDGDPWTPTITRRAVVRDACLCRERQPTGTRDGMNLPMAFREHVLGPAGSEVRGVEQVRVQVKRYSLILRQKQSDNTGAR